MSMKKLVPILLAVVLISTTILVGCGGGPTPTENVLRIGITLPLSGPNAPIGINVRNAMYVYRDYINDTLGGVTIGGETYDVVIHAYDVGDYVPAKCLEAVQKGILDDEVYLWCTTPTDAVVATIYPFIEENDGALFSWGGCGAGRDQTWDRYLGAFIYWPQYMPAGVVYAEEHLPEINSAAYLGMDFASASDARAWTLVATELAGWNITYNNLFPWDITDFYGLMSAVLATDPDCIILSAVTPGIAPRLIEAAYTLNYTGYWYATDTSLPLVLEYVPASYLDGKFIGIKPGIDDPICGPLVNQLAVEARTKYPGGLEDWYPPAWFLMGTIMTGVELADSADAIDICAALLAEPVVNHPSLGPSAWNMEFLMGAPTLLMTGVFVTEVNEEGVEIGQERVSIADWYDANQTFIDDYFETYYG